MSVYDEEVARVSIVTGEDWFWGDVAGVLLRASACDVALQMFGTPEEPEIHVKTFTGDCSLVFDWVFVGFSELRKVAGLAAE